jgi:hypothetical protein
LELLADAAQVFARVIVPLTFSQFTEAFLVSLTAPPEQSGAAVPLPPAAVQFLINSQQGAQASFFNLPNCELILPGCTYRQPVPGWLERITIDARAVAPDDLDTRRTTNLQVVVYRIDRVTRDDWTGGRQ